MASTVEIIANRLYAAGCRHAFGIPGGEVLAMMEALDKAGISFHLTKHENAAGFMAEGAHHATGAPGILLATIGPGLANAVNVIANAEQDRVPLIVLSGCVDDSEALTYTHQVMDHQKLLASITKASFRAVADASDVLVDKALAICFEGQPGPVHIDIPIGLASADHAPDVGPLRGHERPMLAPAEGAALETARAMFRASERPVMMAGVDVLYEDGAPEAVRRFVETHNIPLITTYKGKGILPEDHALSLGGHGLSPKSDSHIMALIERADLVICAGYDPIEMRTGWRNPWPREKAIEFCATANRHDMHHARLSFQSSIAHGLDALQTGAGNREPGSGKANWPGGEPAHTREALHGEFSPKAAWGPAPAIAAIRRAAPRETVATVDSGAHRILLSQIWPCFEPRTLLQSSGLCTMGCALPLAMGYKLAEPDRPVIAFTGDAGLEMVLGELATLRDLKLAILVVVFIDESLALIELKQRKTGRGNLGVDFSGTDFVKLAEALGGVGVLANDTDAVAREVGEAFARRDRFTLLGLPIGRKAYDGAF